MIKLETLRSKIIAGMVGLSLLTAIAIGGFSTFKSSQVISDNGKEMLLMSSENKSNEIYNDLKQVEKNVSLMGEFVKNAANIETKRGMNLLKSRSYAENEYSKLRIYIKKIAENTKWTQTAYFYFNQAYVPSFDGAWYVKKDGRFQRSGLNAPITVEGGDWYYKPIAAEKGLWAKPYIDNDLNISMITYAEPVYKNGFLLGVVGLDLYLDNLNAMVKNIKIYKTTDSFIVDGNNDFVVGDKYKIGDNLSVINNGIYKNLVNIIKTKKSGYLEYKQNGVGKIISYSRLPNGFVLLIDVPTSEVLSQVNGMILMILLLAFVSMIVASAIAIKIGQKISKPIEDLAEISLELANNNLTVNVKSDDSNSEIGQLNRAFSKFILNFRNLISQVNHTVQEVTTGTQEISQASDQTAEGSQQVANTIAELANGSQEQALNVSESVQSIGEINNSIQNILKTMNDTSDIAKNSENNANTGSHKASIAAESSKNVKKSAGQVSDEINNLGQLGSEIGVIVELIKQIAAQTNLLALNAAIEAARAGEHGKGFAVVAGEVKKLANQSAEATDKITSMVKEIQNKTDSTINTMKKTTKDIDDSLQHIEDVENSLKEISIASVSTTFKIQEAVQHIRELAKNTDSVVLMMENIAVIADRSATSTESISSISQEQTASIEEISASSYTLAEMAEALSRQVALFRI